MPDEERLCADDKKTATQVFQEPFVGRSSRQHVAHGSLISSAMLAEVTVAGPSLGWSRRCRVLEPIQP